MLIAMYDYLGYYDICCDGGEVPNPARSFPSPSFIPSLQSGPLLPD
jgi:hypothetical protein